MIDWLRVHIASRDEAEFLYFLAQTTILFVAITALLYAKAQVGEAKANSRIMAHQAQATSLLSLEERWNAQAMRDARRAFGALSRRLRDETFAQHPQLRDDAAMSKVQEKFTDEILRLMKEERAEYTKLMAIFGFFETVGILVKRNYIDIIDVDLLLRGPVLDFSLYYTPHIEFRQNEKGVPSRPGFRRSECTLS